MVESRWLRWIGPGVVALLGVGLIASTTVGAGDRTWSPGSCQGPPGSLSEAARRPLPATLGDMAAEPWFRMDPVLDRDGALRAQRLVVGVGGRRIGSAVELPGESFLAGPFGRTLLVGTDDGSVSRLAVYDVGAGCAWPLALERDVIRRATLDPATSTIYETRVQRDGRADLGVWRRPVDGGASAVRVLAPPPADERFGRTFSTEFVWDTTGTRLAVQSCGEVACRTRFVVGPAGVADPSPDPDAGVLVGFDAGRMVAYGACRGWPCPIVATDLATGAHRILEPIGGRATLAGAPDGPRLVVETRGAERRGLRTIRLDGSGPAAIGPEPTDLGLVVPFGSGSAMRIPPGWVLLGPDGRLPDDRTSVRPQLRRIQDGTTVPLDEVVP
jgi:hypothetical protein